LTLRVDDDQTQILIKRTDWNDQIGNVGGVMGFYVSITILIVQYFAEIDFFTVAIKKLYFEEQNYRKFFGKYVHDDENRDVKSKKNCCSQFFREFFDRKLVIDEEEF